jgi:hypothetical protein
LFLAGNITAAGSQTLTGALTVDSTTDSTSATTGSIQTDGGVGIAKALFVGTTVTINGGTANGVAYLNASKVLTTGSALTFDGNTLGVQATSFTPSSSASSVFIEDKATWAQGLQFYLNNAGTFFNSRPSGALGAANTSGLILSAGALVTNDPDASNGFTATTSAASVYRPVSGVHIWYANTGLTAGNTFTASEQMRLTSTGLGIGTSSPSLKLDVNGSAKFAGSYVSFNDNGYIRTDAANILRFQPGSGGYEFRNAGNSGNLAVLDVSGNLGLGVTPSAWAGGFKAMQIGNYGTFYNASVFVGVGNNWYFDGSNTRYLNTAHATYYAQGNGEHTWFTAPSGTAGDAISFSQVMILDASGNLGVGTTSPSAAASGYTGLDIRGSGGGSIRYGVSGGFNMLTYATGSTVDFVTSAASDIRFFNKAASGESARITAAGELCVGTTAAASTATMLTLNNPASADCQFYLQNTTTGTGNNGFRILMSGNNATITNKESGYISFETSDTERARITSGGDFGIGTSSPQNRLDLGGPSGGRGITWENYDNVFSEFSSGALYLSSNYYGNIGSSGFKTSVTASFGAAGISVSGTGGVGTSGLIQFFVDPTTSKTAGAAFTPTERACITGAGLFGIGTSSPQSQLHVSGTGTVALIESTSGPVYLRFAAPSGVNNGYIGYGDSGGENMTFWTAGSERARIDSSGNLLVGTTSQPTGTYRFVSSTNGTGANGGALFVSNQATTGNEAFSAWHTATSGDNTFCYFGTEASFTTRGSISYNRGAGLVAYNVTSDYRAKDIIGPVTDSGALIDSVPVYMGKMKGATQERPMFIAHEVPAYAHTGEKDAVDADGKPVYQQMDASALIPVMWAEIQSLRARLAAANI